MNIHINKEVIIKDAGAMTHGMCGYIVAYKRDIKKYEVDFNNGFCGWYFITQLRMKRPITKEKRGAGK